MRILAAGTCLLVLLVASDATADPVTEANAWTQSYPVSTVTPHLTINNIWGNIRIRAGESGQISVTIDELRSAPDQIRFDRSLEILKLNVYADTNGVSFSVGDAQQRWDGRQSCRHCRVDYQFEVLVPPGTLIDVSTVVDGRIDVAGVSGNISASNVNGPIAVSELRECGLLESVNGSVELSFVQQPVQDCDIETINGDVTLTMPGGSGLDVALDLFNGQLVSEFQVAAYALPAQVKHSQNNGQHRYQIQQFAGVRLEGGGPTFSISSLNGDIRIQKSR